MAIENTGLSDNHVLALLQFRFNRPLDDEAVTGGDLAREGNSLAKIRVRRSTSFPREPADPSVGCWGDPAACAASTPRRGASATRGGGTFVADAGRSFIGMPRSSACS